MLLLINAKTLTSYGGLRLSVAPSFQVTFVLGESSFTIWFRVRFQSLESQPVNSLWLIITSFAAFAVAYRLYGAFLATKVAMLDDSRPTPAHRLKDGVDYHPTNKIVLFGHHFAAIAGPGPLVGPVLAAQWGYFPGFAWIIIGACLAGGVHDFVILWASVRQNGLTLPQIARANMGPVSGSITSIATLFIIVITLASVGIVVVKALGESSWGMFTIIVTIPAALLTGLWMYKIRPGKVGEASAIGVAIVLAGVFLGKPFAESSMGPSLIFSEGTLSIMLPVYALIASILPVWVLMCPRDYLSSYMKIGVMIVLGVGIVAAHPTLKMPATTPFLSNGPVVPGSVWPFVCIVIMCGAISGFHSLIASGTTPKMINKESDIKPIGYGAMVLEGFVAITALVAACALEPGDYFAINMAPAKNAAFVTQTMTDHQWDVGVKELATLEAETQEKLAGRTGGAVTLAVGMAKVFASVPGMKHLMAYWYHFVIMFEALFILTLLETGTRVARFVFQETFTQFTGSDKRAPELEKAAQAAGPACAKCNADLAGVDMTVLKKGKCPTCGHPFDPENATALDEGKKQPNWAINIGMSVVVCFLWGYLLYTGNIQTLWRMLGIANQLLATIALAVGTTYLLRHAPKRSYALLTGVPLVFVIVTVFAAGIQSVQGWWKEIPVNAQKIEAARAAISEASMLLDEGKALKAANATLKSIQTPFQLQLMCTLAVVMLVLTAIITAGAVMTWMRILRGPPEKAPEPARAA